MRTTLRKASLGVALATLPLAACNSKDEGVAPQPLPDGARVVFTVDHAAMKQGQQARFVARVVDALGNTIPNAVVHYDVVRATGDTAVSVASDGTATGVGPGVGTSTLSASEARPTCRPMWSPSQAMNTFMLLRLPPVRFVIARLEGAMQIKPMDFDGSLLGEELGA